MLKSARAFGLGLLLATQNPVDVDYKALSNAGTWFIGKLQTEQDKNRLLDGLESASGAVPRAEIDKLISTLAKRVFIMHNIHAAQPQLFQTRWAMNFLAGPLTRAQIPDLNRLAGVTKPEPVADLGATQPSKPLDATVLSGSVADLDSPTVMATAPIPHAAPPKVTIDGSITKPPIPAWIKEYYLPQNYSLPEAFSAAGETMAPEVIMEGVIYRPTLLASARVRILDRKLGVDSEIVRTVLVNTPEKRGSIRWEEYAYMGPSVENLDTTSVPSARFGTIDSPLNDTKMMTALQKDFTDWVYRSTFVKARANQALKVFAGPDISQAEFMRACADAARDARDAEIEKKTTTIDRQIKTLEDKLAREERELEMDRNELAGRKREEGSNLLEIGAGVLGVGRKRSITSQFSKNRLTSKAKAEVDESIDAIAKLKQELADLQKRREETVAELNDKWGEVVGNTSEVTVAPKKSDVFVTLFGVAWMPYYIVKTNAGTSELPAFGGQ
jgi:hypothetical protein